MALSTTNETRPAHPQTPTPGVATQGPAPAGIREAMPPGSTAGVGTVPLAGIGMLPGTEGGMTGIAPLGPLRPVLYDDIDPILLARLYPDAGDARAAAIAAGEERAAMSEDVVASQNEPVFIEGDGTTREDRDARARGTGARPARPGQNNPPVVRTPPQQPTSPTRQPAAEHEPLHRPPTVSGSAQHPATHDEKKDDEHKRDEKRDDKK